MSFDWKEYQNLSLNLKNLTVPANLEEAKFRTAISRSYYSARNLAQIWLEKHLHSTFDSNSELRQLRKKLGSHLVIVKIMQAEKNSINVRFLGENLEELKEKREDADYRIDNYKNISANIDKEANNAYYLAQDIIDDLVAFDSIILDIDFEGLKNI
jgi:hypothetical protein